MNVDNLGGGRFFLLKGGGGLKNGKRKGVSCQVNFRDSALLTIHQVYESCLFLPSGFCQRIAGAKSRRRPS